MPNHFHAVVIALNEVDSEDILGDLKAYASRRLNKNWGKPTSETWWTESGSQRPKKTEPAIRNAVRYAWNQEGYFIAEEAKQYLNECGREALAP
jgi:REP element-mobilizing transposase RayT